MRKLSKLQQKLKDTGQMKADSLKDIETPGPVFFPSISELKRMKKIDLLDVAYSMNCDVNPKNTKVEIIAAIEKQSR